MFGEPSQAKSQHENVIAVMISLVVSLASSQQLALTWKRM